ncbi:CKLF-like MARVEL transmembrane domain-containing protein 7 isoform X1 [Oryctolagus cuniculus]|uniref:CKLF-like MARVEL transmembrane domain-containing protein 7 isoform X1 n=1 Tax=Oryctolagus cuniculus TaxID=9986 RepID=UPI003879FAAB
MGKLERKPVVTPGARPPRLSHLLRPGWDRWLVAGAGETLGCTLHAKGSCACVLHHRALSAEVAQVTLLIAFLCVWSSPGTHYSAYSFFEVVTICDLIMILAFYLVHLFRFYRVLTCISWPLSELLHYVIGTLLLLIASIVAASQKNNQGRLVAGAVFGFMATFLCMASVWLSYKISCVTSSTDAAV